MEKYVRIFSYLLGIGSIIIYGSIHSFIPFIFSILFMFLVHIKVRKELITPLSTAGATMIGVIYLGNLQIVYNGFPMENILKHLFGEAGILDVNISLNLLLASIVLWMICYSLLWLGLTLIYKDPVEVDLDQEEL